MSKIQFNMVGGGFQHDICSCANNVPKHVEWVKENHTAAISVHVDNAVFDIVPDKSKLNIAFFCESPYFMRPHTAKFDNPLLKEWALETYKWIFTSDKELIRRHPEFKYIIPHAHPWIQNRQIFPKTKSTSIIASAKREAPGHQLRHMIVEAYGDYIDKFGGGYNPIKVKGEGLNEYMFSFAIENMEADGYFTEKIADCFACGTIPIYWGDPSIGDHFLTEGIVFLNDDFDGSCLTKEFYESKMSFVRENFTRAINLPIPEDYIYLNYIK